MSVDQLRAQTGEMMPQVIADLSSLAAIPSIAFPGFPAEPVLKAAGEVVGLFQAAGVENVRLLPVDGGYPAVYADIPGPAGAPTILLYAHYDIQPAPMEQGWTTEPFTPTMKGNRLYGRGTADDKSGIMMHVGVMRLFGGKPPIGVRILIEGEEETGSSLGPFLTANPQYAEGVDAFVIADGGNERVGYPELAVALRGIVSLTLTVRSLKSMVHSGGFGGGAPDSLMALIRIIDSFLDENGDVAIAGLTRYEWDGDDVHEGRYRESAGMLDNAQLIGTGSLATRLWTRPSITAIGLNAPSVETASNSLIPEASARISLRVAPGSDMAASLQALKDHIKANAPWGVEVEISHADTGNSFKAPTGGAVYQSTRQALTEVFDKPVGAAASGGSIPLLGVLQGIAPDAEFVVWGASDEQYSHVHGPDESLDVTELENMIVAEARLMELLAGQD